MKIVWAVDPFAAGTVPLLQMAAYFTVLGGDKTVVLPTYVASLNESELSLAFDIPERERFGAYPRSLLIRALEENGVPVVNRRVRVLSEPSASFKAAADRLIAYAVEQKADLIAVFSHSNRGVKRVVLGSFAETLVHRSHVSVLVFNPAGRVPASVSNVLFATDLGTRAERALGLVLDALPPRDMRVTVFHHVPPLRPPTELMAARLVKGITDEETERALGPIQRELNELAHMAVDAGFDAEARWEESDGRTSALILKHAKQTKAELIVVTAQAGPLRALFLGSVTRELLRTSPLPVWVART